MEEGNRPRNQKYIKKFIIYAALGIPEVDIENYKLKISGMVEKPLELSYGDLKQLSDAKYTSDFHCVTRWSIKGVEWEGVKIQKLAEMANVDKKAKWMFVKSLDGYTTIIKIEDALDDRAIVAIRMNGKELSIENGYPARVFVPHLYGWKSAKWVEELRFIEKYKDGFWEARGYHEVGNVFKEQRLKNIYE